MQHTGLVIDPQFVLISAGFDAHLRDPLAGMRLSDEGFAGIARSLLGALTERADQRCVAVLEGGYDLEALTGSALRVLEAMAGQDHAGAIATPAVDDAFLRSTLDIHRGYWDL